MGKPNLFINAREKMMLVRLLQEHARYMSNSKSEKKVIELLDKVTDVNWDNC